jgi:acylphosphatase
MAGTLGLQGWVRNRLDGTVEALLEGSAETLDRAQADLRAGPSLSSVERVECREESLDSGPLSGFQIRQTV